MSLLSLISPGHISWGSGVKFCQKCLLHLMSLSCDFCPSVCFLQRIIFVHLCNETYLVMVDDHLDVFLNSVCKHFTEYFHNYIHRKISLLLSFLLNFLWFYVKGELWLLQINLKMFILFLFCGIIWRVLALTITWKSGSIFIKIVWP